MLDLSWLSYTVPTPVWALLTLAGYQKALAMMGRARSGQTRNGTHLKKSPSTQNRKEASEQGDDRGDGRKLPDGSR